MTRIRPYLLTCCCTASLLLASGRATQLRAETPGAEPAVQEAPCAALGGPFAAIPGETAPSAGKQVAQRAGRRWLFRESAGIGYGRYIRSYGDTSGSRGGVGIHESASVEFMLGRHIGLGAGISGQWLIVDSPDVDDGAELSLFGIFRFQFGGGLRVYF